MHSLMEIIILGEEDYVVLRAFVINHHVSETESPAKRIRKETPEATGIVSIGKKFIIINRINRI